MVVRLDVQRRKVEPRDGVRPHLDGRGVEHIELAERDDGERSQRALGEEHVLDRATVPCAVCGHDEVVESLVEVRVCLAIDTRVDLQERDLHVGVERVREVEVDCDLVGDERVKRDVRVDVRHQRRNIQALEARADLRALESRDQRRERRAAPIVLDGNGNSVARLQELWTAFCPESGLIVTPLNAASKVTVPRSIPSWAGERTIESVSMWIPPAGLSDDSLKLLIVTPGRLLNALNEMSFLSDTPSEVVPKEVRRSLSVEIVQVNSSLWSRNVVKSVNLSLSVIVRRPLVCSEHPRSQSRKREEAQSGRCCYPAK